MVSPLETCVLLLHLHPLQLFPSSSTTLASAFLHTVALQTLHEYLTGKIATCEHIADVVPAVTFDEQAAKKQRVEGVGREPRGGPTCVMQRVVCHACAPAEEWVWK